MRWLSFVGKLKLISVADFLDFGSGAFRSRIQAGTLTADRTLTAPDRTGTIAISEETAGVASTAKLLMGVHQIQTARNVNSTGLGSTSDDVFQRFSGLSSRYNVTFSGISTPDNLFDASTDTVAQVAAGAVGTITIDTIAKPFSTPHYYWAGKWLIGLFNLIGGSTIPTIIFEVDNSLNKSGSWVTLATMSPSDFPALLNAIGAKVINSTLYPTSQVRIKIAAASDTGVNLYMMQFYQSLTDEFDSPRNLSAASSTPQNVFGRLIFLDQTESTSPLSGAVQIPGIGLGNGAISLGKRAQFTQVAAASQPNGSLFWDLATGKLSFKDSAGTVNTLY
jgi:hypothetical protein